MQLPTQPNQSSDLPESALSWDVDGEDLEEQMGDTHWAAPTLSAPLWWYRIWRPLRYKKPQALEQWLAYYQGKYASNLPDVKLFQALLARNGCWDIASPFVPGSLQASQFCQDGIFLADIHYLLDRWVVHVMERRLGFFSLPPQDPLAGKDRNNPYVNDKAILPETVSSPFPLWVSNYSPIHYQQAMEMRSTDLRDLTAAMAGAQCLVALFLDNPKHWTWLADRLHADNRALLATIVYEAATQRQRARLSLTWVKHGWMSEAASKRMVETLYDKASPVISDIQQE